MIKYFSNISLTSGSFGLLLLIYLLGGLIVVPYRYMMLNEEVELQGVEEVKREMSRLQGDLEAEYREGRLQFVERHILTVGLGGTITHLMLLSDRNRVLFSTRLAWKGQDITEVYPELDQRLIDEVRLSTTPMVTLSSSRNEVLAIYPVSLSVVGKSPREKKLGFLYLRSDLTQAKSAVWRRLIKENLLGFLVTLLGAALLVIYITRAASKPLQRLVATSQKLAEGDLESRAELGGARELLKLESAFNKMAEQLFNSHKALAAKAALYSVLSETNKAIVRLDNVDDLYTEICRIAVETGDFKLAWIGLVNDTSLLVEPVVAKGLVTEFIFDLKISADPNLPEGMGPTGEAIRGNHHVVVNDFLQTLNVKLWHDQARSAGVRSSASYPLSIDEQVIGAFVVYAGTVGYFTQEIVELLREMARDISFALTNYRREAERKKMEAILVAEQEVLEMVVADRPLEQVLEKTCRNIDGLFERKDAKSSILLLEEGKLMFGAAPGLPESYNQAIHGLVIGPTVGSCGTAAFLKKQIIVSDIQNDPLWQDFRSLAQTHNLAACWSTPMLAANRTVLGTFAVYSSQPCDPSADELALVDRFVRLCIVAIERIGALKEVRQREEDLSVMLDSIGDAVIAVDTEGQITRMNPVAEKLTGWSMEEVGGQSLGEMFHIIDTQTRVRLEAPVDQVILNGKIMGPANHTSLLSRDGVEYNIEESAAPIIDDEGVLKGVILVFHDVTKQYTLRENLRASHERLSAFNSVMPDLGFVFDERGTYLEIYGSGLGLLAGPREDILGKNVGEVLPANVTAAVLAVIGKTLQTGESQVVEYQLDVADGFKYFEGRTALLERDINAGTGKVTWMARDITEQKNAEEEIVQLAFYDQLTKLPNRRLLFDRLEHETVVVKRHQRGAALLFLDLDHFKTLNDSLGHSVGDSLLEQVAQRLSGQVRAGDTVARLGGDEFVVLLSELNVDQEIAASQAMVVAEKMQAILSTPFFLYEHEHHISVSIGISLFSAESDPKSEDILKQADSAMYRSKELGRNRVSFYRPHMQEIADKRLRLEKDLRWALKHDELTPFYQPQIDQQGNCVGLEVLLRWQHAEWGMVSPVEFIPVAEESGLILPMGESVLRKSCQQVKQWQEQGLFGQSGQHVAVNISPKQFAQDDFVELVALVLDETQLDPSMLFLEVTENTVIDNVDDVILKMEQLKAMGVRFSMDDFGTGYSSLSYLKQLPLDQLKIDRSFVMDITTDANDRAIINVILAVAEQLQLKVVAEGVETKEQLDYLTDHNCGIFQGYYFAKPMSAKDLEEWIALTS